MSLGTLGGAIYEAHSFAMRSWRFRVRSAKVLNWPATLPIRRPQVLEQMHEVIGRNVFQISLAERKQDLEKIPWVESASVIRLWPNRFRVIVKERTPVAFIAIGDRIELIDAQGVLMEIPPGVQSDYSFPVILGMNENEPLSTRAPRMKTFMRLMRELDGGEELERHPGKNAILAQSGRGGPLRPGRREGNGEGRLRTDSVASG